MSSSSSSSSPVTRETVSSAVAALTKWMRSNSASSKPSLLLDERDDFIILQLSLRSIPSTARVNPYLLSLPHPLFPTSDLAIGTSVCVIIDDRNPSSVPASSFLDKAKEVGLPISEAVGINTLRTDYRPFESRRKLCASYDLFLADKRIIPLLPKLIGKTFFVKKKNPLPVNFERTGWPEQVKKILGSTFFYLRTGTCIGIRVGRLCMKVDEIVDNVMRVIDEAVEIVPKKWGNVRSLHLKAVESLALPIYQALPEIGLKIDAGERKSLESGEVKNLESGEVLDGGDEVKEEKSEKASEKKGNKEKRKKEAKDGEEEKKIKKNKKEKNEGEIVKAKGEKKAKKDKLEGQNVKGNGKEKMKKKRSKGEMVETTEKKGKRSKIRV
ncbi:hypothetical protein LUZ60_002725 [Juncus effusus]|nr:hypothetical protein LUZ60_002725 [Juncus effusus]